MMANLLSYPENRALKERAEMCAVIKLFNAIENLCGLLVLRINLKYQTVVGLTIHTDRLCALRGCQCF